MTMRHIFDIYQHNDIFGHYEPVSDAVVGIDMDDLGLGPFTAASAMIVGSYIPQTVAAYKAKPTEVFATGNKPIDVSMINQGQIGDCYFLSSLGEEAIYNPSAITNAIHINSNGTETVTLYKSATGSLISFGTKSFKPVSITVTNNFAANAVNGGSTQALQGDFKVIWPQIMEQAFAQLQGGIGAIANGGFPTLAMETLTGHVATAYGTGQMTLANLNTFINAKDLITFDTSVGNSSYNLVGGHCYMFSGLVTSGNTTYAKMLNPWGYWQPSLIPVSVLGKVFTEMDIGTH